MIHTNKHQLVCQSVVGEITSPLGGVNPYRINPDGHADVYPGVGGITYNIMIGDPAGGFFADHVEPGSASATLPSSRGSQVPTGR